MTLPGEDRLLVGRPGWFQSQEENIVSRKVSLRTVVVAVSLSLLVATLAVPAGGEPSPGNDLFEVRPSGGAGRGKWGPMAELHPAYARAAALVAHARNEARLAAQSAGTPAAESMDVDVDGDGVKDIAVVVDNGSIIIPARSANALDLQPGMRIHYSPTAAGFGVALDTDVPLDTELGSDLGLGDDDFAEVTLDWSFPFLGNNYTSVFVGSDGHITFGEGDGSAAPRNAARHVGGPPRASALLTDLDPTCSGSVQAHLRTDRVVVTWNEVVHFQRGFADGCTGVPTNTIQATLFDDGSIDYVFGVLDQELIGGAGPNLEAVTGIAAGNSEGPINEIDMTADLPVELEAGAIFEEYSPGSPETLDIVAIAREFYETHDDFYDFLVTFTDFEIFGGGTAFSAGIKNETLGLGLGTFDFSSIFGSSGELESFLWMNNINLWAGNTAEDFLDPTVHEFAVTTTPRLASFLGGPITPNTAPYELFGMLDITGPGNKTGYAHHGRALIHENPSTEARATRGALRYDLNSAVSIMFQEADHRWGAFSAFVHPTKGIAIPDSFDLLGRDQAHWSTFFNTRVADSPFASADGNPRFSGMEGNALIELATNSGGDIVDENNPSRVIADPNGELLDGLAACDAQGKQMFLTEPDELIDGATELDQYLMGVRTEEEVSPFWYVDDPSSPLDGRSLDEPFPLDFIRGTTFNVDDIAFCGTRVDLTVDNITNLGTILGIPERGPRVPVIGDENDLGPRENCLAGRSGPCADVKTMAFILLLRDGPPMTDAHVQSINKLNEFRLGWQQYVEGGGLGGRNADGVVRPPDDPNFIPKFDTSLEPTIH